MRRLLAFAALTFLAHSVVAQTPADYPPPEKVKASFLKMLDRPKVPLDVKEGTTSKPQEKRPTAPSSACRPFWFVRRRSPGNCPP